MRQLNEFHAFSYQNLVIRVRNDHQCMTTKACSYENSEKINLFRYLALQIIKNKWFCGNTVSNILSKYYFYLMVDSTHFKIVFWWPVAPPLMRIGLTGHWQGLSRWPMPVPHGLSPFLCNAWSHSIWKGNGWLGYFLRSCEMQLCDRMSTHGEPIELFLVPASAPQLVW